MMIMENREEYIESDISEKYKHQIDIWYITYNINRDKIILFYDDIFTDYAHSEFLKYLERLKETLLKTEETDPLNTSIYNSAPGNHYTDNLPG